MMNDKSTPSFDYWAPLDGAGLRFPQLATHSLGTTSKQDPSPVPDPTAKKNIIVSSNSLLVANGIVKHGVQIIFHSKQAMITNRRILSERLYSANLDLIS